MMTDVERAFGRVYPLWNGSSGQRNYKKAVALLRPLAEQGFAPATFTLAIACFDGHGVRKDLDEAFRLFRVAAEAGYPPAQNMLGAIYGSAYPRYRACPHDDGEAARWFEQAARNGNPSAQYNLAVRYRSGLGIAQDLRRAYTWASLAVHCSVIRSRPAEVLREQLAQSLDPDERTAAEQDVAMLGRDLPREQSDHLQFWRHCAQRAGVPI